MISLSRETEISHNFPNSTEAAEKNPGRVGSRFYPTPLIKTDILFSSIRLSDVLNYKACAFAQTDDVGTLYRLYRSWQKKGTGYFIAKVACPL